MARLGLLAILEAKPDKENEVEKFLFDAVRLAQEEPGTVAWYALRLGNSKFGIFDTFNDEAGRKAHLSGKITEELFKKNTELFIQTPMVEEFEILTEKRN